MCSQTRFMTLLFDDEDALCVACMIRRNFNMDETQQQHYVAFNLPYILSDLAMRLDTPGQDVIVKELLLQLLQWYGGRTSADKPRK